MQSESRERTVIQNNFYDPRHYQMQKHEDTGVLIIHPLPGINHGICLFIDIREYLSLLSHLKNKCNLVLYFRELVSDGKFIEIEGFRIPIYDWWGPFQITGVELRDFYSLLVNLQKDYLAFGPTRRLYNRKFYQMDEDENILSITATIGDKYTLLSFPKERFKDLLYALSVADCVEFSVRKKRRRTKDDEEEQKTGSLSITSRRITPDEIQKRNLQGKRSNDMSVLITKSDWTVKPNVLFVFKDVVLDDMSGLNVITNRRRIAAIYSLCHEFYNERDEFKWGETVTIS